MEKQKNIKLAALAAVAVVLIAVIGIALATSTGRSAEETLSQYFRARYETGGGGIPAVVECLAPSVQEDYYNEITAGGTNFIIMTAWSSEATSIVGANVVTKVEILSVEPGSAAKLSSIQSGYREADAYQDVIFRLTLTGDTTTEVFEGEAPMLRADGDWYMLGTNANIQHLGAE